MRILMIMTEGKGGMYQYGALLSNALCKTHEVIAIIPAQAEAEFFNDTVKLIKVDMGDTKARFMQSLVRIDRYRNLIQAVEKHKPDIIHFHNPYNPWTCPALPWLTRYSIIVTIPEGDLHRGMHRRWEMRIARKLHVTSAKAIIVLCQQDKEMVTLYARNKKVFVIPHGENTLFNKYVKDGVKEEGVLFFGGIAPFKGLEYLLKTMPLVQDKVPDSKLLIAGSGNLQPYEHLIKNNPGIEVANRFLSPEEVAHYFQRAKVVACPYIEMDHSGIVPIAYAFGKPVVVSELVSDMVDNGKTGLVVPPANEKALAEAIITLLQNNTLRWEMGRNAREKARKDLNWDVIGDMTLSVYKQSLKKAR